mgnify:CR=1 FL=1
MSRAKANKLYANFSKGLITEASPLAYPEGASIDEKNCDILENGIRTRRFGFSVDTDLYNISSLGSVKGKSHVWTEPGKTEELHFLVIQMDEGLYFWKINSDGTFTSKSFSVDLTTYQLSSYAGSMDATPCQFTSGKGTLYVAHPYMNPISIDYDESGDSITVSTIYIKIRDFIGLDDGLSVDEEPSSLTAAHHYNLRNQGWVDPEATGSGTTITSYSLYGAPYTYSYPTTTGPIAEYYTAKSRYPGNNKQWWVAKDVNGDFDPALLGSIFFGNTRAPRGHFIVDAFNKDYTAVSGVSSLTAVTESTRPPTIEFSSGRVFYGHRGAVYFSPTLEDSSRAGQCFQEADPTAEDISDLIATDGGVIEIPNAENIVALRALGSGVIVFAKNGVWSIASGAAGFTALDYSVTQISDIGTEAEESIVTADNKIFWWSRIGIQALQQTIGQFGPVDGSYDKSNLSDDTIKSFFNVINDGSRNNAQGEFDPATNKIYWLYKENDEDDYIYRKILIYDLNNQAFVPWELQSTSENYYWTGIFIAPYFSYLPTEGNKTLEATFTQFLCFKNKYVSTTTAEPKLSVGNFFSRQYVDFYTLYVQNEQYEGGSHADEVLALYDSYITTGYEVLEDGVRRKQAPIVGVFFERVEEDIQLSDGSYELTQPQSCFFQAKWDWSSRASSNKWSTSVQAYRPKMTMFVDTSTLEANSADYDVFYSRNKVRGSGRSVQFKFSESRQGYGFKLIGWHVFYEAKTNP